MVELAKIFHKKSPSEPQFKNCLLNTQPKYTHKKKLWHRLQLCDFLIKLIKHKLT